MASFFQSSSAAAAACVTVRSKAGMRGLFMSAISIDVRLDSAFREASLHARAHERQPNSRT